MIVPTTGMNFTKAKLEMRVPNYIGYEYNACDFGVSCPGTEGSMQKLSLTLHEYAFGVHASGQFEIKILNDPDISKPDKIYCIRFPAAEQS